MKKDTIDVKVGIWDDEYIIRDYGTHIIVTVPFVKNGSLSSYKVRVTDIGDMEAVRIFVERDSLIEPANNNGHALSLQNVLDGNRYADVHLLDEWEV